MKTIIRQIYLYLVSAISLTAVTWAIILLARLILREQIGPGQITELASLLAVIIVGLPIFLLHWLIAQRLVAHNLEERRSIVRRVYFGLIMSIGFVPIIANVYRLVDNLFLALLDGQTETYYPYNMTTGEHLAVIIAWGIVWLYLWRQVQTDNRLLPAQTMYTGVRRLYVYIFAQVGLVMAGLGAISLLKTLMESVSTSINWQNTISNASAQLLVGSAIWLAHWLPAQKAFFTGTPDEERSLVRKIYLYLNIFSFSLMTVFSASTLLKRFIELALGAPPAEKPLLSQLSVPVPLLIVGGILWAYHWYVLNHDIQQAPEAPRQGTVRRIYGYLVAAIGLAVLLSGIVGLLSLLIDMLTTPADIGLDFYREQLSIFAAMIIVGIPVWLLPWRRLQNLALMPADATPEDQPAGQSAIQERGSTTRKIYLYFYILIAMLAIFGSAGWFVYHILTALLGADLPDDFITLVLDALIITLLAVGVGVYHWLAIRKDGQLEKTDQAHQLANVTVAVLDDDAGELGQSIIQHLQHELPGIQINAIGLTEAAVTAMNGQPFTPETIAAASYIVGAWQTFVIPQVAAALETSTALKLAVPIADPHWNWIGLHQHPTEYYGRQTAHSIRQAIEGHEIGTNHDIITTILTGAGVLGGLIFLLIVGVSVAGIIS